MPRSSRQHPPGRVLAEEVATSATPGELIDALAAQPAPALLDSSALDMRYGRYTVLACRPADAVIVRDGHVTDAAGGVPEGPTVIDRLRAVLGRYRATGPAPLPYGPGWIGFVGYEFGRNLERLPGRAVRDTSLPDLHLAFYDATAVYDAIGKRWTLLWLDRPESARTREALREVLLSGAGRGEPAAPADRASAAALPAVEATSNFAPDAYRRAVARCVEYIAAGDIFQVNLSQRFTVPDAPPPLEIYKLLRRRNPAWYSAMLLLEGAAVLSSSPELFLRIRGRKVLTRPIKGTRPRTGDARADAEAAAALVASEKDNAELAMIIDLLRNDLGRVCRFGTVRVPNRRELETHPTVFHLVGSVVGELRDEVDVADVLAATFPGGSITGAPKIRAMEIIDELEPVARGVYTGAIGWIGADGDAELNIVIRTVVWDAGTAHVQVGGGIVADSTPDGEYQETLDKARALLEAMAMARGGTGL
ncbi:MAG TPA: aminodeoxychorismate synthase component I [Phycisphaerae bacterium]|nr:aminodeoxychorismate synthase component I [Phycisphaerae bacterium]